MIIGTILAFAVVVIITQLEANAATASMSLSFEQTQTINVAGLQAALILVQLHLV